MKINRFVGLVVLLLAGISPVFLSGATAARDSATSACTFRARYVDISGLNVVVQEISNAGCDNLRIDRVPNTTTWRIVGVIE